MIISPFVRLTKHPVEIMLKARAKENYKRMTYAERRAAGYIKPKK